MVEAILRLLRRVLWVPAVLEEVSEQAVFVVGSIAGVEVSEVAMVETGGSDRVVVTSAVVTMDMALLLTLQVDLEDDSATGLVAVGMTVVAAHMMTDPMDETVTVTATEKATTTETTLVVLVATWNLSGQEAKTVMVMEVGIVTETTTDLVMKKTGNDTMTETTRTPANCDVTDQPQIKFFPSMQKITPSIHTQLGSRGGFSLSA